MPHGNDVIKNRESLQAINTRPASHSPTTRHRVHDHTTGVNTFKPIAIPLNIYKLTFITSNIEIYRLCKAERPGFEQSVNVLFTMCCHIHIMLVLPATKSPGAILNARSAARRAEGRKPGVTQASSVLSHWITAYIHVCCPSGQPLAVQICSRQI